MNLYSASALLMRRVRGIPSVRGARAGFAVDFADERLARLALVGGAKYANNRRKTPKFELKTFYGQIQHIILVQMPATQQLDLLEPETVILASIKNCPIERHNDLDMHYYQNEQGSTEIVDIATIQCLVGRVFDRGWWAIIDRSGKLARAASFEE